MTENAKGTLERSIKTFVETAIAYALPAISGIDYFSGNNKKTVLYGILISAVASGLSAVFNGVIKPMLENKTSSTVAEDTQSDDYITEDESEVNANG